MLFRSPSLSIDLPPIIVPPPELHFPLNLLTLLPVPEVKNSMNRARRIKQYCCAVEPNRIILHPPMLCQDFCFEQCIKDLQIKAYRICYCMVRYMTDKKSCLAFFSLPYILFDRIILYGIIILEVKI